MSAYDPKRTYGTVKNSGEGRCQYDEMGRGANGVGNIMKTSVMSARTTCLVSAGLLGALCALLPTVSLATTYTYTEGSSTDIVPSFSFTTSLTGAALDNLAPGTDITATVDPFTFQPRGVPPKIMQDFRLAARSAQATSA